jgi:type I restriction enzyme M protein
MPRNLGEKRKQVASGQIAEIVAIHSSVAEGPRSRIVENESLGYQRVTVERPLRVRYEVNASTPDRLTESSAWIELTGTDRGALLAMVEQLKGLSTDDRAAVSARAAALKLQKKAANLFWETVSTRDSTAKLVENNGHPEPDPGLRDYENVSLPRGAVRFDADPLPRLARTEYRLAVDKWITAEVLPFVPDAWVDHSKSRIGYEIPFARFFDTYVPPRPLSEIDADLEAITAEIEALTRKAIGK